MHYDLSRRLTVLPLVKGAPHIALGNTRIYLEK